jgi:hypothetical protein
MGVAHEEKSAVIEEDHAGGCHFDAEALSATFNPILRKDGRHALYFDMSTALLKLPGRLFLSRDGQIEHL